MAAKGGRDRRAAVFPLAFQAQVRERQVLPLKGDCQAQVNRFHRGTRILAQQHEVACDVGEQASKGAVQPKAGALPC